MKFENLLTGTAGIAGTALVSGADLNQLTTTLVQLVIGVITIVQLFKKPKKNENEKTSL